ncbi:component of the polarisome, partial [Nowakowskiella sp. JEL0407]
MAQRPPDAVGDVAYMHYESLKQYAASYLQGQAQSGNRQSSQRASAREKLTRLTRQQFEELCTNVFDEMRRRQYNSHEYPFLPINPDYHPKRNQARQKLATLHVSRFKDLAVDVYLEIERRFPNVANIYLQRWGSDNMQPDYPSSPPKQHQSPPREFRENPISPKQSNSNLKQQRMDFGRDPRDLDPRDQRDPRDLDPHSPGKPNGRAPGYGKSPGALSPKTANLDLLLADLGDLMVDDDDKNGVPPVPENGYRRSGGGGGGRDADRLWDENEALKKRIDQLENENRKMKEEMAAERREMDYQGTDAQK